MPLRPDQEGSTFAADFEDEFGNAPGAYAAEGFDATNVFLEGLEEGPAPGRSMLEWVNDYTGRASARIRVRRAGDVPLSKVVIWAYELQGGR